jgi:hypothetical protein
MDRMLLTVYDADGASAEHLVTVLGMHRPVRQPLGPTTHPVRDPAPARVIALRFDRLGAAAAAPDHHRPPARQRFEAAEGVVVECAAAAGASEITVTVIASDPAVAGTVVPITINDGDRPSTAYLAAMTPEARGAAGRIIAAARSDAPLVAITLPPHAIGSLTADDAPAVRRSVSGATADGLVFWLELAAARALDDPVAVAVHEGLT